MKPAGPLLLITAGLATVLAAGETTGGLGSREIMAHIREGLPTYNPPPHKAEGPAAGYQPESGTLVLPKLTVREKRLPKDADDHLMSRSEFKRKMENIYLDEIAKDGPLNYVLNCFTIPLLSPSKAARGNAIYRAREMDRLQRVIDVSTSLDSSANKQYRQDMDNTWTTRPAGELQGKATP